MQTKIRTFLSLPMTDIARLLEAVIMLAAARFLIKFISFSKWRQWLDLDHKGVPARVPVADDKGLARDICRVVRMAARHVPFKAVCLPQAMAAQWMLRRRKEQSKIVIGADRKAGLEQQDDNRLDLHAWLVSSDGIIVTGKNEYGRFHAFGAHKADTDKQRRDAAAGRAG